MLKKILSLLSVLLWTSALSVLAQGQEHPICFEIQTIDLGKVMDNAGSISKVFHFKNTGKKTFSILEITTSCSCLTARYDKKPVEPGEKGEIVLTFDPHNFSSDVEVKALIYTDYSGMTPAQKLSMKAQVQLSDKWRHLPYKIGNLRLKRTHLNIGEVTNSNQRKERILCANAGKEPMKITGQMLPPYARLTTDPVVIPPDSEADIWIHIDGKKLSSMRDRTKEVHFKILLQGTGGSPASRMIEISIQPQ